MLIESTCYSELISEVSSCADLANCFNVPAGAFDAPGAGSPDVLGDLFFLTVIFFVFGKIWRETTSDVSDLDGEDGQPAHPSAISQPGVADKRKNKIEFGWLHADLRVPLPPYEDLKNSCHLIGAGVGDHEGYQMYLCASKAPSDSNLSSCELSQDFTKHYGNPVYLCRSP